METTIPLIVKSGTLAHERLTRALDWGEIPEPEDGVITLDCTLVYEVRRPESGVGESGGSVPLTVYWKGPSGICYPLMDFFDEMDLYRALDNMAETG